MYNIIQKEQLTHYTNKKQYNRHMKQFNKTKINKIKAVSYSTVQGHLQTDEMAS